MQDGTSAAMMRNNHAGALLQQLNTHGGNQSRSSAFSALPQGLSGGLGLPEFALFSQLQGLAAFSNPQQSTFSPEVLQLLTQQQQQQQQLQQQQQRQAQQLPQGSHQAAAPLPPGNQPQQQQLHLGPSQPHDNSGRGKSKSGDSKTSSAYASRHQAAEQRRRSRINERCVVSL